MRAVARKAQGGHIPCPDEFSWNHEKTMPDGGQCKGLPVIGKTQPFKPCHQIIGKEREFGIEGVGIECGGRSLAERIIFLECSDDSFHGSAFLIVSEYVVWFHGKVGDDDRISMPVKGKKCGLGVCGLIGQFSS